MSDKRPGNLQSGEAWKPWQMLAFDAPAEPQAPRQPAAPSQAELHAKIESLRNAAMTRGHAEGYAAGHDQGLALGIAEGREQGRKQGHETGLQTGHAAGQENARLEAQQLESLAHACADALIAVENEMGQAMISLAISIAERVLRSTLDAHPEKILDLIRDITHVDTSKEAVLRLRLNPADQDLVQRYLNKEPGTSHWQLVPDESIERGGCRAETPLGNIDATLQTRWQRVISSLGRDSQPLTRTTPDAAAR